MTYRALPFLILLAASALSCGSVNKSRSTATLPGTWQVMPIAIDGDSKDWPSPYPNYDAKSRVAYATSNDGANLYITMQSGDEMTQMKILKQGMTVSIDTTGKKEAGLNINFPLPSENDLFDMAGKADGITRKDNSHASRMQQKIAKAADEAIQFSIDGSKDCNGGYITTQTSRCGIRVTIRMDEYNELVWEAVVPFSAIYNKDSITAADAGRPISVCFAVKAFKNGAAKNNSNAGMNNNMGSSNMGNNNMGGGVGNSGMRNSSPVGASTERSTTTDPLQHLYDATKTWKQFGLAYKR